MNVSGRPCNYVIPSATKWADAQLLRIYNQALCQGRGSLLSRNLLSNSINITYGYLGNYARAFKSCNDSLALPPFSSTYILDHAYGPSNLKGNIFRMANANKDLTSLIFHTPDLLCKEHKTAILANLEDLLSNPSISFSIPNNQIRLASKSRSFSLFIKASAFLNSLFGSKLTGFYNRINFLQESSLDIPVLTSVKPHEVYVDERGETVSSKYPVSNVTARFDSFKCVYCPTSMMAIPFILHSIPVHLSPVHPLSGLLGTFVPPLPSHVALEMIYECLLKTSVSLSRFDHLESYLSDLSF